MYSVCTYVQYIHIVHTTKEVNCILMQFLLYIFCDRKYFEEQFFIDFFSVSETRNEEGGEGYHVRGTGIN